MSPMERLSSNHDYLLAKLESIQNHIKILSTDKHVLAHCVYSENTSLTSSSLLMAKLNNVEGQVEESLSDLSSSCQESFTQLAEKFNGVVMLAGQFHMNLRNSELYMCALDTQIRQSEDEPNLSDVDNQLALLIHQARNFH